MKRYYVELCESFCGQKILKKKKKKKKKLRFLHLRIKMLLLLDIINIRMKILQGEAEK